MASGSAQDEQDLPNDEVQQLRSEFQLAVEHWQVSTMHAMRSMMAEFMTDNGRSESSVAEGSVAVGERPAGAGTTAVFTAVRETTAAVGACIGQSESGSAESSAAVGTSPRRARPTPVRETPAAVGAAIGQSESGSAEKSAAVGKSPRGAGPITAVRGTTAGGETIFRDDDSRKFGSTGRGKTASCRGCPARGQPNRPRRAGKRGAYPSGDFGGDSAATAGGNGSSAKATEGSTFIGKCFKCGKKGHRIANCREKRCSGCNGMGHAADVCPAPEAEAVLSMASEVGTRDVDIGTAQASAFKVEETGKCSDGLGRMGEGESAWQVGDEAWICDSGASTHMTPSADCMLNYRECNLKLRIADGSTRSIEGYGDVRFVFRSGNGLVQVLLTNVAHVPDLRYHLFSLPTLVKNGHTFEGRPSGIVVRLKSERSIVFPLSGNLYSLYGYRIDSSSGENACAVLAPGQQPKKPVIDINDYHCSAGHSHEVLLRKTAEQQGIVLEGNLLECRGCSMAKGLRKGIKQSTHTRAGTKLGRVFVDLSGPKVVESLGRKRYTLIVRDDFSRYTWVYFIRQKSDAAELFEQFLADSRADDVPSKVVIVRSDGGGEFRGGKFGDLCRTRGIKQEFTTADSPQFNGVAERALGLIETAAMAGRIQARELYPGTQLPATESLWAEASHWACDALNRTATTANPESKSPYEMWYGRPPPVVLLPFLKPGYCKVKRENKSQAKAQECFYLGPAPNYPRDSVRVLTRHRTVLITRNITWQRVSPAPPVPAQLSDSLSMEEGGSEADDASTSDQGGGGVVHELDKGLARLNDLDLTWGFDLDAFLEERAQQAPAAGDAGDGNSETMGSSQGGAVDASSAPVGRVETAETIGSSQGGAVDASSVPAGRAESDPGEASASDTDQGNGEDPPAVLSGRVAHESSWGRLPATVRGRTRGQSQHLEGEPAGC